jgi:GNAT superfamily N-acetyltransferase
MLLVEELAARAWPAAETLRADGWLLRHTPSLTRRRSNSALALADGGDPAVVEAFYAQRGRPAYVQVSPAERRAGIDAELARRGWQRDGPTDMLVADADTVLARTRAGEIALAARPEPSWVAAWAACDPRPDAGEHVRDVFARIALPAAFARAGGDLGAGVAVCERGWVGLFSIATAPAARRRGIASAMVHALTRWGVERGARHAYLQVESDNAGAQGFWASVGFRRSHGYHYRVAPGPRAP